MGKRIKAVLAASVIALAGLWSAAAMAQEERTYILTTATTGGTFYPVGIALATVTKTRLAPETGISLSAISSAGSAENIRLLRQNEAQFAILQGLWGAWAHKGDGPLKAEGPQNDLRSITMLWDNVEHFVIHARHAKTGTVADMANLRRRKFSIGARNSGAEGSNRYVLNQLGIDPDSLTLVYQGYGPSADSLANGTVEGISTPAGTPVSAVTRAFATAGKNLRLLSFTDDQLAAVNKGFPLWTRSVIPAGTYPNQDQDVATIAHPNILAVRADVDEDAVYRITATLYGNLPLLNSIHSATKDMSLARALDGLSLPLHPGAARFFREQGLDVPDTLTAD